MDRSELYTGSSFHNIYILVNSLPIQLGRITELMEQAYHFEYGISKLRPRIA